MPKPKVVIRAKDHKKVANCKTCGGFGEVFRTYPSTIVDGQTICHWSRQVCPDCRGGWVDYVEVK